MSEHQHGSGQRENHEHHDQGRHDRDERRGPEGTSFLQLELSQVIASDGYRLAQEAIKDLLRERVREHIKTLWGDRIDAVAKVVAEDFVADLEANLSIEQAIEQNKARQQEIIGRVRAALRPQKP